MKSSETTRWQKIYRRLLRLFPADFRWDFGGEMEDTFAQQYEAARQQGGAMSTTRLWWKTVNEMIRTAPGQHLEMLRMDSLYAFRMMRKNPLFTLVAVLTLALGVGSLTASFSILNAFFLRPLPFRDPARLVHVWQTDSQMGNQELRVSVPNFEDWQRQSSSFVDLAGYYYQGKNLGPQFASEDVVAGVLTTNMFDLLGVEPILGRTFNQSEGVPGNERVVVLGERFWRRHFNSDPTILGRTLRLDEVPYEIIGVMPESFIFPFPMAQLWTPLPLAPYRDERAGNGPLLVVGRLREGVSRSQAQQELGSVMARLVEAYPEENASKGINIIDLRRALLFKFDMLQVTAVALLLAAAIVVLIVCANLGNLQLARAAARKQEVAIRAAVGAGSTRLLRQLLTESLILSFLGGILGVILAQVVARAADGVLPTQLYRVGRIEIDLPTLAFALLVCVGAALVFGLAPAVQAARADLVSALKEGTRGGGPARSSQRLRAFLVISQVALATLLVAGAVLMLQTFQRLQTTRTGFNPHHLLTYELRLPKSKYPGGPEQNIFFEDLLRRVRNYPGVVNAAMINPMPLNFESYALAFQLLGGPSTSQRKLFSNYVRVTTDFFKTAQISLLRGRVFDSGDTRDSRPVAIVNQRLAEQFSPDRDPVGRTFRVVEGEIEQDIEIVGLVEDSKIVSLSEERTAAIYLSQSQGSHRRRFLWVRTAGEPQELLLPLQGVIREKDPDLPISESKTMDDVLFESLGPWLGGTAGLSFLGLGSVLLAALGLYGVVSYSVGQRRHEFGVRIALGAPRQHILALVVSRALRLTGYGVALGLVAAYALTRSLSVLLFGVGELDPVTYLGTPLLLALVALVAALLPARQALSVDPIQALRVE